MGVLRWKITQSSDDLEVRNCMCVFMDKLSFWYDIYLLQLGFHPIAVVVKLVQNWERENTIGETVHKTILKHRIYIIENRNTKQKQIWRDY